MISDAALESLPVPITNPLTAISAEPKSAVLLPRACVASKARSVTRRVSFRHRALPLLPPLVKREGEGENVDAVCRNITWPECDDAVFIALQGFLIEQQKAFAERLTHARYAFFSTGSVRSESVHEQIMVWHDE